MPPQLEKHHVVPTSWQDEALARDGVSRDVPCCALKGETVPDSLHVTPKSSPTRRVPSRGTPRVPAPLPLSPFSPPDRDRRGDYPAWSGRGSQHSLAHLRMKPVSRGNSRRATCVAKNAERPRFPGPLLRRTRGQDLFSKATLWVKAQHEGALPPPCIVRKDPRVPHTARRGA